MCIGAAKRPPGAFLNGCLVLRPHGVRVRVVPGGLFETKHFQFLTGLKKSSEDEMKMVMMVRLWISEVSAFLNVCCLFWQQSLLDKTDE